MHNQPVFHTKMNKSTLYNGLSTIKGLLQKKMVYYLEMTCGNCKRDQTDH